MTKIGPTVLWKTTNVPSPLLLRCWVHSGSSWCTALGWRRRSRCIGFHLRDLTDQSTWAAPGPSGNWPQSLPGQRGRFVCSQKDLQHVKLFSYHFHTGHQWLPTLLLVPGTNSERTSSWLSSHFSSLWIWSTCSWNATILEGRTEGEDRGHSKFQGRWQHFLCNFTPQDVTVNYWWVIIVLQWILCMIY